MHSHDIIVEPATAVSVAPFGHLIAARDDIPVFARWPGATVHGPLPIEVGAGGEMLFAAIDAKSFPVECGLIERHFLHTQTYLSANAKPFVMLLGAPTDGDLPDCANLRAFLFEDGAGIILHAGVWHDFPYALEDGTRFSVVLRQEAHVNTNEAPAYPMDADGPDLQRRAMRPRATILTHLQKD